MNKKNQLHLNSQLIACEIIENLSKVPKLKSDVVILSLKSGYRI